MNAPESAPFQVDLRGVVDLLSRSIYSTPRVFLRELLQNSRDAITARAEVEPARPEWGVRIVPLSRDNERFEIHDDGVGLTLDEMRELLSTVGRSSKRDLFDMPRTDFLGQFGIGLLSCFMVSDVITIESRSAKGGPTVRWVGYSDGTFEVSEIYSERPVGTSAYLVPSPDRRELLEVKSVVDDATRYGEFLPIPLSVSMSTGAPITINRAPVFLDDRAAPTSALLDYGSSLLGSEPLDVIPIDIPSTGTQGVCFVLPQPPPPGARQANRVYLGRMLLGERIDELVPDWAFFTRAVVNSTGLNPTASREDLVSDDALSETREAIGRSIRAWILDISVNDPRRLAAVVQAHEFSLKEVSIFDDELARAIASYLTVETSEGRMSLGDIAERNNEIRYTNTVDEFRQLTAVLQQGDLLVNGGFTHDAEIVQAYALQRKGAVAKAVDVVGEIRALAAPALDDRATTRRFEERAEQVLKELDVDVVVRSIADNALASLYVLDPQVLRSIDRDRVKDVGGDLWGGVVGNLGAFVAESAPSNAPKRPALMVNWNANVVRTLSGTDDGLVFDRALKLLYVQALMAGQHQLRPRDRELLTESLSDLLALSLSTAEPTTELDNQGEPV